MNSSSTDGVVLALDVGSVRIGVARCLADVRIPQPLTTITYDQATVVQDIQGLVDTQRATTLVVGWPRGLEGQSTQQTVFVETLVDQLRSTLEVPIQLQDEALTSHRAETELKARKKPYAKADVDALAATYILEDFLSTPSPELPRV